MESLDSSCLWGVFSGNFFTGVQYNGFVVVKFANPGSEEHLATDSQCFPVGMMLVYPGVIFILVEIMLQNFQTTCRIHRAGIIHNDPFPKTYCGTITSASMIDH